MAMQQPSPDISHRVKIAGFSKYTDAQAAVDKLSDSKFPVQHVSIVGSDLRMVENVMGRMSWGRAALSGLGTGLWLGLLIGLLLLLFAGEQGTWKILGICLVYGAAFGIVFGLIAYAFTGGKRDFVSRSTVVAHSYDVLVDPEVSAQAQQILGVSAAPAQSAVGQAAQAHGVQPPAAGNAPGQGGAPTAGA